MFSKSELFLFNLYISIARNGRFRVRTEIEQSLSLSISLKILSRSLFVLFVECYAIAHPNKKRAVKNCDQIKSQIKVFIFDRLTKQTTCDNALKLAFLPKFSTRFWPMFQFHTSWKYKKRFGFRVFSGVIQWKH